MMHARSGVLYLNAFSLYLHHAIGLSEHNPIMYLLYKSTQSFSWITYSQDWPDGILGAFLVHLPILIHDEISFQVAVVIVGGVEVGDHSGRDT